MRTGMASVSNANRKAGYKKCMFIDVLMQMCEFISFSTADFCPLTAFM